MAKATKPYTADDAVTDRVAARELQRVGAPSTGPMDRVRLYESRPGASRQKTGDINLPAEKHQMDPKTMSSKDWKGFDSRPGRPLSAPPWRETGRETVKRVLRGDINLPVDKPAAKKSLRSRAISKR